MSPVLSRLRADLPAAQSLYRDFVCEKIGDHTSIWDKVVGGIFLGSEPWLEKMRTLIESKPRSDAHPRQQTAAGRPSVDRIVDAVAEVFDISATDLRDGHGGAPRMVMAWLSRYESIARLTKIAATLRLRSSGYVSDLIAFSDRELGRDHLLRDLVDRCIALLRPDPTPLAVERIAYWPALPLTDIPRPTADGCPRRRSFSDASRKNAPTLQRWQTRLPGRLRTIRRFSLSMEERIARYRRLRDKSFMTASWRRLGE